jgi:putative tryptophan/tyrosine transport system substrate-binding protein
VLWSTGSGSGAASQWKANQTAAQQLGLQALSLEVRRSEDLESAFKDAVKARSGALAVTSSTLSSANRRRIVDLATKNRLPAMYAGSEYVDVGGLMYYGANTSDLYRRAAVYVDKILKGTKPADLPVEQPTKFELIINLKAAKQIGLTIPPNVLARADKVLK